MKKKLMRISLSCAVLAAAMLSLTAVDSQAARFRGAASPRAVSGPGLGAARMDANQDGINDYTGLPLGTGKGIAFVDANGDGHNDNMDANGDGINDITGQPLGTPPLGVPAGTGMMGSGFGGRGRR
ncbi:MAG: hypothetical protein WC001_11575 [Desulfurivibrionaceae bacterium]